jgi:ribosome recycling factor
VTAADILAEADTHMELAVEYAKEEFAAIRTGRAHPAMFAKINAEYYGAYTPLQQLASFQVPEARMVLVTPYDRGSLPAIEKAIRESDLGVNPSNDGKLIRCVFPELTEERRKEYIKVAKTKAEDAKVSVRNIRRHAMDQVHKTVKDGDAGEDEGKSAEKRLDGLTKKFVDSIDDLLKHKEAELLEV